MNAYELADELEECREYELPEFVHKTAVMLRQQADRIAELEKQLSGYQTATKHYREKFEKQSEPVAWRKIEKDGYWVYYETKCWDDLTPLYTTPQTKPLSDEEIYEMYAGPVTSDREMVDFARAIEAKVRGE